MVKMLVTFASEHGATAEIAQMIARTLRRRGIDVIARRVEEVHDLNGVDGVVFGSAIYLGQWSQKGVDFLTGYVDQLEMLPTWLFSSGPTGRGDPITLLNGAIIPDELLPLVQQIRPADVVVFHGKIDLRRLPNHERDIIKATGIPRGDFRDWEAIKGWAGEVADAMLNIAQAEPVRSGALSSR